MNEDTYNSRARGKGSRVEFLESLLDDEQSLHMQLSRGMTNKVPNLTEGGLDTLENVEYAHNLDPVVTCPECGYDSTPDIDAEWPLVEWSLVIRSSTNQLSYLCHQCWGHWLLDDNPNFNIGVYTTEDLS